MIHQHYKLITPETKEVKVDVEDLEEDSKAEYLVEDFKEVLYGTTKETSLQAIQIKEAGAR